MRPNTDARNAVIDTVARGLDGTQQVLYVDLRALAEEVGLSPAELVLAAETVLGY